jgi:hypothetical protein
MKKLIGVLLLINFNIYLFAQIPDYVPTDSLKGWWSFSGNALDATSNGINGIVNNASTSTDHNGVVNSAYYFNGSNQWINLGDNPLLNPGVNDFTISAWIKTSSISGARIFSKGSNGGYQPGYDLMIYPNATGKVALIYCPGTGGFSEKQLFSNTALNNNQWHMITGVITRNSTMKLYVDGILQNSTIDISTSASANISSNTYNAAIGVSYSKNGTPNVLNEFFNGSIDEVGFWKRSLSSCEISSLYVERFRGLNTTLSVCSSFTAPSGKVTWENSGIYKDTLVSTNGCDSILTFDLTVTGLPEVSIDSVGKYIHVNSESIKLTATPAGGVFSGDGVSDNYFNPTLSGKGKKQIKYFYSNEYGCSNIAKMDVIVYDTIHTFTDTIRFSVADTLIITRSFTTGVTQNENTFKIYPNPTNQFIIIDNGNYENMNEYKITIQNQLNQIIFQHQINQPQFIIDISSWNLNGLYLFQLVDNLGNIIETKKIIVK